MKFLGPLEKNYNLQSLMITLYDVNHNDKSPGWCLEPVQTILQSHHFSSRPAARPYVSFEIYSLKFIGARPYVYFKVNTDESLGMMIMPKRIKIYS